MRRRDINLIFPASPNARYPRMAVRLILDSARRGPRRLMHITAVTCWPGRSANNKFRQVDAEVDNDLDQDSSATTADVEPLSSLQNEMR